MQVSLALFTWLANESLVMNLFPTGITASHLCSLHLQNHIMVITALQNYLEALVPAVNLKTGLPIKVRRNNGENKPSIPLELSATDLDFCSTLFSSHKPRQIHNLHNCSSN